MAGFELTRLEVLARAWPIVLANAAVPLLGVADTAILGHGGAVAELGALALGALVFGFVYWSFGFLRMGTTGFVAQAAGATDEPEVRAAVGRALLLGWLLGTALILLAWPLKLLAFGVLDASPEVERIAASYFDARIWGAPATLGLYALMGCFIGLGQSRLLLATQLLLNALNIGLDVWFAWGLGWGASGIGLGTAVAEWTTLVAALVLAVRALKRRHRDSEPFIVKDRLRRFAALKKTLTSNADIMLRTLALLFGFAWFTNQGAQFGDVTLAANHLLLQFLMFSAFFLDGFAFVAEALVGSAVGARDRQGLRQAIRLTSELSAVTAAVLALATVLLGPLAVEGLTDLPEVHQAASEQLPLAAVYIFCGFAAFQLDGVFIGATRTREMRNASVVALGVFLSCWWMLEGLGNQGLWLSLITYVVARALSLAWYFPALARSLEGSRVADPG